MPMSRCSFCQECEVSNYKNAAQHAASSLHLTRRTALKGFGVAGLAMLFATQGVSLAKARKDQYRKLAITAVNYRFRLPASVPAGYTEVTLNNKGTEAHHAMFMRLHKGITVANFMDAAKNKDLGALFAISSSIGGPGSADGGHESSVILDLKAGHYVVICVVPDAAGMPHYKMGMLAPLTVTATSRMGKAPVADTTVDMVDFGYNGLPKTIPAGRHVWKVVDTGKQLHEMVVHRLSPGVSYEQAKAMLMASPPPGSPAAAAAPAPTTPPPFVDVTGVAPMSPGEANWAVFDFKPGRYFVACFIPDIHSGKPHFDLGMIMPFTVV